MKQEHNEKNETLKDLLDPQKRENLFDGSPEVNIDFVNYIKNATKKVKLQSKDWDFRYPLDSGITIRDTNDKLFDFTRLRSNDGISEIWFVNEVVETSPFFLEPTGESAILSNGILSQLLDKGLHFEFQSLCTWGGNEIEVQLNEQK
jgi:hypothetical protein